MSIEHNLLERSSQHAVVIDVDAFHVQPRNRDFRIGVHAKYGSNIFNEHIKNPLPKSWCVLSQHRAIREKP